MVSLTVEIICEGNIETLGYIGTAELSDLLYSINDGQVAGCIEIVEKKEIDNITYWAARAGAAANTF